MNQEMNQMKEILGLMDEKIKNLIPSEETLNNSFRQLEDDNDYKEGYAKGYADGAKDQRLLDEEVRLIKSDEQTKEQADREVAFAEWYIANGEGQPTFSDAIEWARVQTVEEVIGYLKKNVNKEIVGATRRSGAHVSVLFYNRLRNEILKLE